MNRIIEEFCFLLYRVLIHLAVGLLHIGKSFWPQKLKKMITERDELRLPLLADDPIWIHASSGEIEYAKPVIRALQQQHPKVPIILSYFSPSAERLLPKETEFLKVFCLPWDTRGRMRNCFQTLKPKALLIARTDAWPELVQQSSQRRVPILLFAYTLSENSSHLKWWAKALYKRTLRRIDRIHAVTEVDRENFARLLPPDRVMVTGDTRYDQVLHRLEHPQLQIPKPAFLKGRTFIAGSTWPEDEKILLPVLIEFVRRGNSVILAPHELKASQLETLRSTCASAKVNCVSLTELEANRGKQIPAEENLNTGAFLTVDRVGVLADLYAWADAAFVGGSFKAKVHSVMEALAHGLPVCVGPHHLNNREAIEFQKIIVSGTAAVTCLHSASEFEAWLRQLSNSDFPKAELSRILRQKAGATNQVLQFLESKFFAKNQN